MPPDCSVCQSVLTSDHHREDALSRVPSGRAQGTSPSHETNPMRDRTVSQDILQGLLLYPV